MSFPAAATPAIETRALRRRFREARAAGFDVVRDPRSGAPDVARGEKEAA